jgi:hypothetical protein
MTVYLNWNNNNYASNLFTLRKNAHYILPKPKFLFYAQFNISPSGKRLLSGDAERRLGFMLKSVDRPNIQYQQQDLNQYNKKRTVTTGVTYGSMNFVLHDTVDEVALRLIKDYSSYYYHDFNNSPAAWRYDVVQGTDHTSNFGYSPRSGGHDIYFFDSIDIYEFYNGYYTKYKIMNPKFENVSFGSNDMTASEGNEVSMTIKPEGIVWEAITADMTAEVSNLLGLPFRSGTTGNYRFERIQKTVGEGINTSGNGVADFGFDVGGPGSFIGQAVGDIFGNIVNQVIAPTVSSFAGSFLSNAGLSILQPTANSLISTGTRALTSAIGRIF